jgi:hypothetical protein
MTRMSWRWGKDEVELNAGRLWAQQFDLHLESKESSSKRYGPNRAKEYATYFWL